MIYEQADDEPWLREVLDEARRPRGVIRGKMQCMTMLSFRVSDEEADAVRDWADALGVDRSEILRDALHRHLVVLSGEADAERWRQRPATDAERSLEAIADWGPAEDWSDWNDATR